MSEDDLEQTLFVHRECDVYRLPQLQSSRGQFAAEWRDKIFSGRIRVMGKGDTATIRIEDPHSGDLFVAAPIKAGEEAVQPVVDSSRYFVIKVEDETGHHAFLGMGFTERGPAFDFNVAIQDHKKWATRQAKIAEDRAAQPETAAGAPPSDKFALKQGETFSIKIGGNASGTARSPAPAAGAAAPILLAPPPPSTGGSSSARDARKARSAGGAAAAATPAGGNLLDMSSVAAAVPAASKPAAATGNLLDDFADFTSGSSQAKPAAANGGAVDEWSVFK